jgi:hypothetical protein
MPSTGSRQSRGYDVGHGQQRKAWAPIVARGEATCHAVLCLEGSRAIAPRSEWHLGHTPDRTAWTGPEHPRCNTSEGATRGNATRKGLKHSREW